MSRSAARKAANILTFAAAGALAACAAIMDAERPEVASVTLSESSVNLEVEAAQQLSATARDAAGNALAGRQIFWSSEDTTVVRVTATGVVTGVRPGSARIAASVESKSGIADVAVVPKPVASVTIAPTSANLPVGATLQLEVTLRDASGSVLEGRQVRWESSAPDAAAVEENGLVRALAIGSATITATSEGRSGTASVNVLSGPPARMEALGGGGNGAVGAPLPDSLAVRVTDASGNPAPGVTVVWAVTSGEGSIEPPATVTSTEGVARAQWTLGSRAGNQTARATVAGLTPVSFSARARPGLVASVTVEPASATLTALTATRAFTATAYDAHQNPVPDQIFTWTSSTTAVAGINSSGVAVAAANGQTTITASAGSVSGTATLQVAQTVARVTIGSGNLTLLVGDTVRLGAAATDANNYPVAGAAINWGTSSSAIATVTAQGLVRGVGAGTATITAASGEQSASVRVRVEAVPVASVTVSPSAVTRSIGESAEFSATAYDASGNVLTGRAITWESSNTQVASVNASGVALALRPGTANIIARSEGKQGTALVTVTPGPPANLVMVSGNDQPATVGTAVPQPLVVRVTDAGGNPVSGVAVTWTVIAGGGTLSPQSAVTDAAGLASAGWTLGSQLGGNTARAAVSGLAPVTFSAVAVAGPPAAIQIVSGTNQVGAAAQTLPEPLVVRVADAYGNPVSGVRVTWTVLRGNGIVNPSTNNTNAQGQAATYWTLGNGPPEQVVEARVGSLEPVVFIAFRGVLR